MRKTFAYLVSALIVCLLALTLFTPVTVQRVKASDLQEKCDDCSIRNFQQFEHCQAVHGQEYQRCYDQYNEGVVQCFRNFCEQ
jgi:hypothetical protein